MANNTRLQVLEQRIAKVSASKKNLKRLIKDAADKAKARNDKIELQRLAGLRADLDLFSGEGWREKVIGVGPRAKAIRVTISEAIIASCQEADGSIESIRAATRLCHESIALIDPELDRMNASLSALFELAEAEAKEKRKVEIKDNLRRKIVEMHDVDAWISSDLVDQIGEEFLYRYFREVHNVELSSQLMHDVFFCCTARISGLRTREVLRELGDTRKFVDQFIRELNSGEVRAYISRLGIEGFDELLLSASFLSMRIVSIIKSIDDQKKVKTGLDVYKYLSDRYGRFVVDWKRDVLEIGAKHGSVRFKEKEAREILVNLEVPLDVLNIMPDSAISRPVARLFGLWRFG